MLLLTATTKKINMKQLTLLILCIACLKVSHGQSATEIKQDTDTFRIFNKVEVEANFPGGNTAWGEYLQKHLNPSVPVKKGAPKGNYTVIVKFIIGRDGNVSEVACENDPGYGMCEESVRVIKKTPKWIPAEEKGRKVNAYRRQPISFLVQ